MYPTLRRTASQRRHAEHLLGLLDDLASRARALRATAAQLEDEKVSIQRLIEKFTSDEELKHCEDIDKGDLLAERARVEELLSGVTVHVGVNRTDSQQDSYTNVMNVIEGLYNALAEAEQNRSPLDIASLESYLNATSPDNSGPVNEKFQSLVLSSTLDDQKSYRRRLADLLQRAKEHNERVESQMRQDFRPSTEPAVVARPGIKTSVAAPKVVAPSPASTKSSKPTPATSSSAMQLDEEEYSDRMRAPVHAPPPRREHTRDERPYRKNRQFDAPLVDAWDADSDLGERYHPARHDATSEPYARMAREYKRPHPSRTTLYPSPFLQPTSARPPQRTRAYDPLMPYPFGVWG